MEQALISQGFASQAFSPDPRVRHSGFTYELPSHLLPRKPELPVDGVFSEKPLFTAENPHAVGSEPIPVGRQMSPAVTQHLVRVHEYEGEQKKLRSKG